MKTNTLLLIIIIILVIVFLPLLASAAIVMLPLLIIFGIILCISVFYSKIQNKISEKRKADEEIYSQKKREEDAARLEAEKQEKEQAQQQWNNKYLEPLMSYIQSDETVLTVFIGLNSSAYFENPGLFYSIDQERLIDIIKHFFELKAIEVKPYCVLVINNIDLLLFSPLWFG